MTQANFRQACLTQQLNHHIKRPLVDFSLCLGVAAWPRPSLRRPKWWATLATAFWWARPVGGGLMRCVAEGRCRYCRKSQKGRTHRAQLPFEEDGCAGPYLGTALRALALRPFYQNAAACTWPRDDCLFTQYSRMAYAIVDPERWSKRSRHGRGPQLIGGHQGHGP